MEATLQAVANVLLKSTSPDMCKPGSVKQKTGKLGYMRFTQTELAEARD